MFKKFNFCGWSDEEKSIRQKSFDYPVFMRLDRDFCKFKNVNHSQVKPSKGFESGGQWFFEEKSKNSWKNAVIRKKCEKTVMNSIDIRGTHCNEPQKWGSYDQPDILIIAAG